MPRSALRTRSFVWRCTFAATVLSGAACEQRGTAEPPSATDSREPLTAQAFTIAFNLRTGTVAVSAPTGGALGTRGETVGQNGGARKVVSGHGVSYSLLGTGLVDLRASNFSAGAIGAVEAGKVLIRIDLTVVNLLNAALITPTFPAPPAGLTGVQAFPLEIRAASVADGPFVVSPPGTGPVQASLDWSGAPHNFLNDTVCGLPSSDCFRYEPFSNIAPLGMSEPRTVGFLVDPTIMEFRVSMLLAADLQAPTAP